MKCRGVFPPHPIRCTSVRSPESWLIAKTTSVSSPRLLAYRKYPSGEIASSAAVLVPLGWRWFYVGVSATALANQFVVYYFWNHYVGTGDTIHRHRFVLASFAATSVAGSAANLVLFAWGTWRLVRPTGPGAVPTPRPDDGPAGGH